MLKHASMTIEIEQSFSIRRVQAQKLDPADRKLIAKRRCRQPTTGMYAMRLSQRSLRKNSWD
jgi:hypothetical protein